MVPVRPTPNGYRMPTEAEWVFMARYEGGRRAGDKPLKYAWGKALPPARGSGNIADRSASSLLPVTVGGYTDGFAAAAPVGRFSPNHAGLHDLSGNVVMHRIKPDNAPQQNGKAAKYLSPTAGRR